MENEVLGLHHVTAIARSAQANYDFYSKVLGLRLVKKTVNFDDPGTYHLYYGDETGSPGTLLTFFPWEGAAKGLIGPGMATEISFSVPAGSLSFWQGRLQQAGIEHGPINERFNEKYLALEDPDGLLLNLVQSGYKDDREPWTTGEIPREMAVRGFHSVVLTIRDPRQTANILTSVFGYQLSAQEGNRYRYTTKATNTANVIDLVDAPDGKPGIAASGTNHHIAFRVQNDGELPELRQKIEKLGLYITEKIDRQYFYSLYFREPGGVLFELASDNPGFAVDEPVAELGTHLKLPAPLERRRQFIEEVLPPLIP